MTINASMVKGLRDRTGAGMMDCKNALKECDGDEEKAIDWLRKKGISKAAKKSGRTASEGAVASYIHAGGKVGVLIEVNCETDFVARTAEFQAFVKDLSMHVAASNPRWVKKEDVPADAMDREREVIKAELKEQGKPEAMVEKIADGKMEKFYSENCLNLQKFVKDPDKSVDEYIQENVGKLGENMFVSRFVRFSLGEGI